MVGCAPQALTISLTPHGRPYLPDHADIDFNLSHTTDRVALAVCRGGRVGIDIEQPDRISETEALEILNSPAFQFTGLLMICTSDFREPALLCDRVFNELAPLRTFCLLGCNQDEMDAGFLGKVDVVLPLQTSSADLVSRLKSVLEKS